MSWKPIGRLSPEVVGINKRYTDLIDVKIRLTSALPAKWVELFKSNAGQEIGGRSVSINEDTVTFSSTEEELREVIAQVDRRIAAANDGYANFVLPEQEAARKRAAAEASMLSGLRTRGSSWKDFEKGRARWSTPS
jgi:hypothetical protein